MARYQDIESSHPSPLEHRRTLPGQLLARAPTLQDDGRLDVNVDTRTVKALSSLVTTRTWPAKPRTASKLPPNLNRHDDSEPYPVKLNIVIQVVGSRGDVQPFVALGNELQKQGHRIRLATHNKFDSFIREAGLEFYPIGGDPTELMAYMVRNPGLIPSMTSLREGDIRSKRVMMSEMLRGCWLSCIEPDTVTLDPFVADAIIANPPSFAHVHCAQALGVPLHMMFTMPWTSTGEFPHPLVNLSFGSNATVVEPRAVNHMSYGIVEFLTWQGLGDVINKWRSTLDLEAISFSDGPGLVEALDIPFTYCWSPALVPKPEDWSPNIDVCGFFFREPPAYTPPSRLQAFLEAGQPPIYIGFGSIVIDDPRALSETILEAVRLSGTRALISRGWSNLDGPESDQVMFLGDCPHEWLFQQVAAVIHHGGAGTTACGLLNGKPTTIIPFFGDQPFWGNMVAAAGAGPPPIPHKSVSVARLVEAIQYCLTPHANEAAGVVAAKMRRENGVKQAVASFHAHLPGAVLECDIVKGQAAAWSYSGRGTELRLSKVAADILMSHLKVDARRLKKLETRRFVIEARRWDPFSATIVATMGAAGDLAKAAARIVVKPAKTVSGGVQVGPRSCLETVGAMVLAFLSGLRSLLGALVTGVVTIPFAFTEGLRHTPRHWGQEIRDVGEVRDWQTGLATGPLVMLFAIYDAISGFVVLPYKKVMDHGPLGLFVGLALAILNLPIMALTATMATVTYALMGFYKTAWALMNPKTRHSIETARLLEGRYLAEKRRNRAQGDRVVLETFDALLKKELRY